MIAASKQWWVFVVVALAMLAGGLARPVAGNDTTDVQDLEKLTARWLKLRRELNAVKIEWKKKKSLLNDELEMLRKRRKELKEKIASEKRERTGIEEKIENIEEKRERFRESIKRYEDEVREAGERVRELYAQLPTGLKNSMNDKFNQNNTPGNEVGKRFQRVFTRYDELARANARVHVVREVIEVPDETRREAEVLYLGLERGYAVLPDAPRAAVGELTDSGWTWSRGEVEASVVREALKCYRSEKAPAFVPLPLSVEEGE